jgi:aryl-phospho-beta-D-glucosidase BglC (GH1 family)
MTKTLSLFTFIILFLITPLHAQLTPTQAVAEMGRGINLGNTLEPPTEGAWNNGPAQESYFDAYLSAGFTNIRVPVRWDQHTGESSPYTVDPIWMDRVEQVVDWGLSRGLYITLNGHHEDWLKNDYSNPTLQARYDSIWTQIMERFQNKSDKLLFEIINEPNGMTVAEVDDLNARILGIIRITNPTRIVIYGGNIYSNSNELINAAIPIDDYVIGYYHAYDPWPFAGQSMGTWGTANDYQQLTNKFQSVKNWSTDNNIAIHLSEFGAKVSNDFNSRMRLYAHNVEQSIINGFAFSAWDDGGDFNILNRDNNTWPETKEILIHYYEDSPNQIFSTIVLTPVTDDPTVVVDWNNRVTGNDSIMLERAIGITGDFNLIATIAPSATTYTDVDVTNGTYTYRMYTARADGTLLHGYPTRVMINSGGGVQASFSGTAIPIPGELEVEDYDLGGEGLAYHDIDAANQGGGYRLDEGVDIGGNGLGGFVLGYVAQEEWLEFAVNVTQAGTYIVTADVASEIANGAFSISFEENNASTDFDTPSTGDWNDFTQITANNEIVLEEGLQQMRLEITNGNAFNLDKLIFTLESANSTAEVDAIAAGFTISPNPTDGWLKIDLSESLVRENNLLQLFNVTGAKVGDFKINGNATILDLGNYPRGTYFLHLTNGERSLVHRVIVQ